MNTSSPRCAVPGSPCRLLQLELPDPRPVWAALDAAGSRHFTGELTLHLDPVVRVWFSQGEVYLAERETDPPLTRRLVDAGVVSADDLARGTVRAGEVHHLGRLFERVPTVDRDLVELTVEMQTATVLGEIADRVVPSLSTASYRYHSSGVLRWSQRPAVTVPEHRDTPDARDLPDTHDTDDTHDTGEAATATIGPVVDEIGAQIIDVPIALVPAPVRVIVRPPESTISASMIDEVAALAALVAEQAAAFPGLIESAAPSAPAIASIDATAITTQVPMIDDADPAATATDDDDELISPDEAEEPAPTFVSTGPVDLTRIIQQVAAETAEGTPFVEGAPVSPGADEPLHISDDVRAAVRQALAEIEAATRPALTDGLSVESLLEAGPAAIEPTLSELRELSATAADAADTVAAEAVKPHRLGALNGSWLSSRRH